MSTLPVPWWSGDGVSLHLGDCREVMAQFPPDTFDAVCTDPPYDLTSGKKGGTGEASLNPDSPAGRSRIGTGGGFMGQRWDATGVAFDPETWRAVYRVMKPGAYLLSFGGSRTYHRMACAVEDAGFEITDSIDWIYAAGFAKSLNISKAIDKAAGAVREVVAEGKPVRRLIPGATQNRTGSWVKDDGREYVPAETAPATEEAAEWEGWGTALRPSHETIVVARKPFKGTYAANVLRYGTGALNVDACRVSAGQDYRDKCASVVGLDSNRNGDAYGEWTGERSDSSSDLGRWPANVLLTHSERCEPAGTRKVKGDRRAGQPKGARPGGFGDVGAESGGTAPNGTMHGDQLADVWICAEGCPVSELDRQTGVSVSRSSAGRQTPKHGTAALGDFAGTSNLAGHDDSGGASRFFPVFHYCPKAPTAERPKLPDGTAHSTVKPCDLMSWLVRLVSNRDALILDPFAGSGATGQAALAEGRRIVLIEKEQPFAELVRVRLAKPIALSLFDTEEAS